VLKYCNDGIFTEGAQNPRALITAHKKQTVAAVIDFKPRALKLSSTALFPDALPGSRRS
jgi:hypothetical protein